MDSLAQESTILVMCFCKHAFISYILKPYGFIYDFNHFNLSEFHVLIPKITIMSMRAL